MFMFIISSFAKKFNFPSSVYENVKNCFNLKMHYGKSTINHFILSKISRYLEVIRTVRPKLHQQTPGKMSDKERMPTVDFSKLKQSDLDFIKIVEKQNRERVEKLRRLRRNNNITGAIIGCGVLGIYFYSMYAVRQERFLDDFDEPIKIVEKQ